MAEQRTDIPVTATRESLLRLRNTAPKEPYDVPGIGRVWVHGLKHIEAKQWHQAEKESAGAGPDLYSDARMLVKSLRDEAGQPLFKSGDETLIVEWPEFVVQNLLTLCLKVNGLSKEVDEGLLKNFEKILTSGS
jgi:hypothetical protein